MDDISRDFLLIILGTVIGFIIGILMFASFISDELSKTLSSGYIQHDHVTYSVTVMEKK